MTQNKQDLFPASLLLKQAGKEPTIKKILNSTLLFSSSLLDMNTPLLIHFWEQKN